MGRLFGTDGIRGIYGEDLNDTLAKRLGFFGTKVLAEGDNPKVILAMDTRESSPLIESALVDGVTAAGGEVLLAGVIPTPAVPVLIRKFGADFGIMITASHNPYEFNGIKFFDKNGYKLKEEKELEIEEPVLSEEVINVDLKGEAQSIESAEKIYLDFLLDHDHKSLNGKKIVLDCSNGATSEIAEDYFTQLGAEVVAVGAEPNGRNINDGVGSTHIKNLCNYVIKENGDFGFAFDGDGDRCLAVDETGEVIDGDKIMYLISKKLKENGDLKKDKIVITVMSNIGLIEALQNEGLDFSRTDVGDHLVLEEMLENGYNLGGEQSGHIILLDRNSTGDGMIAASEIADIIVSSGKKASELSNQMKVYPQVLENAKVPNDKKDMYLEDEEIQKEIDRLEKDFNGKGRVLIRPSGTEPLVRVMIEGEDQDVITKRAKSLARLIEEKFN